MFPYPSKTKVKLLGYIYVRVCVCVYYELIPPPSLTSYSNNLQLQEYYDHPYDQHCESCNCPKPLRDDLEGDLFKSADRFDSSAICTS